MLIKVDSKCLKRWRNSKWRRLLHESWDTVTYTSCAVKLVIVLFIHSFFHSFNSWNAFTETFCNHLTAQSSAEWRDESISLADHHQIWLADKTLRCDSSSVRRHIDAYLMRSCAILWILAAQRPCPVRKRFNIDHVERPRLKPGSRIVKSEMKFLLATETDCYSSLHWDAVSAGDRSDQNRLSGS